MEGKALSITLMPEKDVLREGSHYRALSGEPWMQIVPNNRFESGDLIDITYRSSLWDEPVRPVFRFWFDDIHFKDFVGIGPVAGAACVTLEVPKNTIRLSVSPAKELGRFDFLIEEIRVCSRLEVFKKSLTYGVWPTPLRIAGKLIGLRQQDLQLDWGLGLCSIHCFPDWLKRNSREADLNGCDAPRCDWEKIQEIQLFLHIEPNGEKSCVDTIRSLQAQIFRRWRLNIIAADEVEGLTSDPRVHLINRDEAFHLLRNLPPDALAGSLYPGDELYPNALGFIAEAQAQYPNALVFYGDECVERTGTSLHPILKPGWSPLLTSETAYLSQAVFFRGPELDDAKTGLIERGRVNISAIFDLRADQVRPLRRFLRKTTWLKTIDSAAPPPAFASSEINPSAMIIIPTRDQTDLLGRCLRGIFDRTSFQNYSIIIVDNDSVELASKKFFKAFFGDKIVSVSHSPGPYNFSALCNAGASRRRPDVLVFLKNHVEIQKEDWLTRLVTHALLPEVGAVGSSGLYHGRSFEKPLAALMPFEKAAHEILAVSADCLAVGRRKFLLTGGFDAGNFPNVLQNVDFCLRLREKGFVSRVDPAVGVSTLGASETKAALEEQSRFHERWPSFRRDDPYFHPGLSLVFAQKDNWSS